jgi:hypothetical protein
MIGPAPMMRIDLMSVRFGMVLALARSQDTAGEGKNRPDTPVRAKPALQLSTAPQGKRPNMVVKRAV